MYTQSNVYAKRISSGTLLALLLISALVFLLPTGVVKGSTGSAGLAGAKLSGDTITAYTLSSSYVSVYAGGSAVKSIDGASPAEENTFAVVFNDVTFSGGQFVFYLSTNALSEINTTAGETSDIAFGPTFYTANFTDYNCETACLEVPSTLTGVGSVTYYQGNVGGEQIVAGPIPLEISNAYKYIKIFDGTSGAVAVSKEYVNILPGIKVDPNEGAAGITVSVSGGGFAGRSALPNIAINYTYTFTAWDNVATLENGTWISSGITNNGGWFTKTASMLDTKQAVNPPTHGSDIYSVVITFTAVNGSKLKQAFTSQAGDATFTEYSRVFNEVVTHFDGSTGTYTAPSSGWGNDSGYAPVVPLIDVYVTGTITVEGNYSNAASSVTVTLGSSTKTVTSNSISGEYTATITIPNLPIGDNTLYVSNNGVTYQFTVYVEPTLVLTPDSGTTSGCNGALNNVCPNGASPSDNPTTVTVTAYGFPANNNVWIYWDSITYMDDLAFNLVNASTNSIGSFTAPVSFVVPSPTFGGDHAVYAVVNSTTAYLGHNDTAYIVAEYSESSSNFDVLPSLVVASDNATINSNAIGFVNVYAEGLTPGVTYMVQVDHSIYSYIYGIDDCYTHYNGNGQINFTSTGFTPGVHQVEITPFGYTYEDIDYYYENYTAPAAWTYFNVTTTGDYTVEAIHGIASSVTTAVNNALASFSVSLTNIQNGVTSIQSTLSTVASDVSSIQSSLSSLSSTVTSDFSSVQSSLSSISSQLSSISSNASTAASAATQAASNTTSNSSGISTAQTYVLVVAVLAAITLVLELAILVRKLS